MTAQQIKPGPLNFVHPSADVEDPAALGEGVRVWRWTHVRRGARVGDYTSIGQGCYVDEGVEIGEHCKIQNGVQMYRGLTVGDEVFIGPNVTFTNDKYPKAVGEWHVIPTVVENFASIGAGAVIVCGVTIGEGALVAAGAVVTRDVPRGTTVKGPRAK